MDQTLDITLLSGSRTTDDQEKMAAIDTDLDEFAAWVANEMSGPIQSPLHPSERAIIKTYLVRKLLPDLVRTRTG